LKRVILIFIDGWGLGPGDPEKNPFFRFKLPFISKCIEKNCRPVDACLDVEGLPQSATGQTALLTGQNAPGILGRHVEGFPNRELIRILETENVYKKILSMGLSCDFLNAYQHEFFTRKKSKRFWSCTTVSAMAGLGRVRTLEMLVKGRAVYQEITNRLLIERGYQVPLISPEKAAQNLVECSRELAFSLFEYFQTDRCGHSRDMGLAREILGHLERFLKHIAENLDPEEDLLVITSDHGNIEDMSTKLHTRNPVPLIALGPGKQEFMDGINNICQIQPAILESLSPIKKT
jgi:hypothetical protein